MERRLAAIMSADVKGYTALMAQNEEATVRTLGECRAVMADLIPVHRGRVVDSPGDNLLAEFSSVVDALKCAVEIQTALNAKNAPLPPERRMLFRIGLNLGDVIVEDGRIYGDGVNIAARLEGLADPGGICVSGTVFDQVKNKFTWDFEYLGQQAVKNVPEPIRVYRVLFPRPGQAKVLSRTGPDWRRWRQAILSHLPWLVAGLALVLAGLALGLWWWSHSPQANHRDMDMGMSMAPAPPASQKPAPAQGQEVRPGQKEVSPPAKAARPLPDKPSLAVLPFANLSDDKDQEYFADGLTEDLTTDLGRLPGLFVIARNSAFTYKGKSVKPEEVSRDLGVRYVLEGSVRRSGETVRITAQLIDAQTGYHLWAERYDRPLRDILALQDEVVGKIAAALSVRLTGAEKPAAAPKAGINPEVYDLVLKARELSHRASPQRLEEIRAMARRAIDLDPGYARAHVVLGQTYLWAWTRGFNDDPATLHRAEEYAQQALKLEPDLAAAHNFLGAVKLWKREHAEAIKAFHQAMALDPNDANSHALLAAASNYTGHPQDAPALIEKALRLDPRAEPSYNVHLAHARLLMGQYEQAVQILSRIVSAHPRGQTARVFLAIALAKAGRLEEAKAEVAAIKKINPGYDLAAFRLRAPYQDPQVAQDLAQALARAGLN